MLDRYYKIRSELTSVLQDNVDNARLLLNVGEDILVEFYLRKFVKFNSIMLSLQSSSCSIKIASLYINGLLTKFPEYTAIWNKHLDLSPFERSINMVMKGDSINLEPSQKYLLKHFEINNEHENQDDLGKEEDTELDFAEELHREQIESERKRRRIQSNEYIDLNWIPCTSVICEREFSIASNVFDSNRQSMHPTRLEELLFLKHNSSLWSIKTLKEIIDKE
jgi:hypothetical protein